MKLLSQVLLGLVSLVLGGTALAQAGSAYKLRHGDALTVSVWRDEALRMQVRVLPDGSITFPLAGRVEVVGLSTSEAELRVAEKLKRFDEMEQMLRKVIALAPDNAGAYNALGYSFADRNINLPEARKLIEQADLVFEEILESLPVGLFLFFLLQLSVCVAGATLSRRFGRSGRGLQFFLFLGCAG